MGSNWHHKFLENKQIHITTMSKDFFTKFIALQLKHELKPFNESKRLQKYQQASKYYKL